MMFLLYKFFKSEKYRDEFLSGLLYSNKLSYYRTKENETKGVPDSFENAKIIAWSDKDHFIQQRLVSKYGAMGVESIVYDIKPDDYIENQGFISFHHNDYNVFCMSSIIMDEAGIVRRFDKRNKDDFGRYGVLIKNTAEFLARVKSSDVDGQGVTSFYCGFVEYIDFEKRDAIQSWGPFRKFSRFSYQQEYRLVFECNAVGAFRYNIGSVEDISLKIDDKEEFFNSANEGEPLLRT